MQAKHIAALPLFLTCLLCFLGQSVMGALVERWAASDLAGLDDGDSVGTWTSSGNRTASAPIGEEPKLKKRATPTGEPAVLFSQSRLSSTSSPVGGLSSFSIIIVFKANGAGVDEGTGWSTKSGIVDANQSNVSNDWGFSLRETGFICFGTGSSGGSDQTVYLDNQPTYGSVVDGNYHVAVCTWGGGSQSLFLDTLPVKTQTGVSTGARANAGFSIGGIHSGEASRRFDGEIAEVRFYDQALSPAEASQVIDQLNSFYITRPVPQITNFSVSPGTVLLGSPVTLSWAVSNVSFVTIQGVGDFVGAAGSTQVVPLASTVYTLIASNSTAVRTSQASVTVDPGIPLAYGQSASVIRDTTKSLVLTGFDPQGQALTFSIAQQPRHGTLSGAGSNIVYAPAPGYLGLDFFTFTVNDGSFTSAPATIDLYVDASATAPHGLFLSRQKLNAAAPENGFLAGIRAVDANRLETFTFTLVPGAGAAHNGMFRISGNRLSAGPGFPLTSDTNLNLRIRATDSTGLFVEQTFLAEMRVPTDALVINEIHYNPSENTLREEFVEIFNPGKVAVDISGWRLRGAVEFTFPVGTRIAGGAYLVVASNPQTLLARYGAAALGPWTGNLSSDGERISLRTYSDELVDEVDYGSEFPWPIAANGEGSSMELLSPRLDNDLGSSWRASPLTNRPSPGLANGNFVTNAAPNIRQVEHSPKSPGSTNSVVISAKVTDPEGVVSVQLMMQIVAPGKFVPSYIPLSATQLNATPTAIPQNNAAYHNGANWTVFPMHDDGLNGDEVAGDDVYTVVLPPQANRTLVRYRISCADIFGATARAPFEDDPSLNFAYFVYNGIPSYGGVSAADMQTLPVYHLITRSEDFDACNAYGSYQLPQFGANGLASEARFVFNWPGAIVYDGEVYDNIRYRLRGANGRYQPGKRNFRFRFNNGKAFQAKDEFGQAYPRKWTSLSTAKGQSNRETLTYSLNEYVNFLLLNTVGVPAPRSHYFHWRVVRGVSEAPDNYTGDFYGTSWAQEEYDAGFLESHGLPKGNLYKLINATRATDAYVDMQRQQRYQGPSAVTNGGDAVRIQQLLLSPNSSQTDAWLQENVNYTNWYAYHAILEAVRNYDTWPSANKNAAWYFDTNYTIDNGFNGRFWTLPWDWTDTWGPTWNAGQDLAWNGIFGSTASYHTNMQKEYRNTAREIRELVFQPDQLNSIIDAVAARLARVSRADVMRWSNCPPAGSSYLNLGAAGPALAGGLSGYAQEMKRFMFEGGYAYWWNDRPTVSTGGWVTRLDTISTDYAVPTRPSINYAGVAGFPLNALVFESSKFLDPQGSGTFGAMQWRVAEVRDTNQPPADPRVLPPLEWNAIWTSDPLTEWTNRITIPAAYLTTNKLYRARVRHSDNTGRWSRWSAPIEFKAGPVDIAAEWRQNLHFSEIMYNPPAWGGYAGDELEFIELYNSGADSLDMGGLTFTSGITFTFTNGTTLGPGAYVLLGRSRAALSAKYPGITVGGIYSGKLDNGGEALTLSLPSGVPLISVTYGTRAPWPVTADGYGYSLVSDESRAGAYRASSAAGGSPGGADPDPGIPRIVINEIVANSPALSSDRIELFNPTASSVDLTGWYLSDDAKAPFKYRIPGGILLPGAHRVFTEADFNNGSATSFILSSLGEEVYLFSANASSQLTGYSHGFAFNGTKEGESLGRYVNSVGDEQFPPQIQNTFGTENLGPRVGPVVIDEIFCSPTTNQPSYVELLNVSEAIVPLYDPQVPTNTWRLNGLGFSFPVNVSLAPRSVTLLTSCSAAEFRAFYNLPLEVSVFQYPGQLQSEGEALEILSPDVWSSQGTPYHIVDRVKYSTSYPWPQVLGTTFSLHRTHAMDYGDDPLNWAAGVPSPGTYALAPTPTPQVTAAVAEGNMILTFAVEANRSCSIEYKDSLSEASWKLLKLIPTQPAGRIETIVETLGNGSRFYRLSMPAL